MTPRRRRTLAEREAQAITTPTTRTTSTPPSPPPARTPARTRVSTPVWISDNLWAQAKAAYLADQARGTTTSWRDWVEQAINHHNPHNPHNQPESPTGPARSRTLWLTPATRDRLDTQVHHHALKGHATTRATLITTALTTATTRARQNNGGDLPPFTGHLRRGPTPTTRTDPPAPTATRPGRTAR